MNAPRMLSNPNFSASTTKAISRSIAARTRISAVVSCSRSRTSPSRVDREESVTATPTRSTSPTNIPRSSSRERGSVSVPENSRDSSSTAAKSATDEAAMVVCPSRPSTAPASFSTATTSPREVAETVTASSSGSASQLAPFRASPADQPTTTDTAYPTTEKASSRPRSRCTSISRPARKSSIASPSRETIWTARSGSTQPSTDGPTTMPSTISRTTAGTRTRGANPSTRGASSATTSTPSRFTKSTAGTAASTGRDGPSGPAAGPALHLGVAAGPVAEGREQPVPGHRVEVVGRDPAGGRDRRADLVQVVLAHQADGQVLVEPAPRRRLQRALQVVRDELDELGTGQAVG